MGKGRQIAGVILDNYARGRRRNVWISTSSDLHYDAERDLRALGCHITIINNCQTLDRETRALGLAKDMQEGVLFMCAFSPSQLVWKCLSSLESSMGGFCECLCVGALRSEPKMVWQQCDLIIIASWALLVLPAFCSACRLTGSMRSCSLSASSMLGMP